MLRPIHPTPRGNVALYTTDRQSVREGFAPASATVPLGTYDTPSKLDRRLVLSGLTVEDGKWNPPSLAPRSQRSCGRGADQAIREALAVAMSAFCGSQSRAGRSLRQRRPAYNHNVHTPLSPVGSDGMTSRLRPAYNHTLRTPLRNPKTDPTGLIQRNGSVADAAPSSPCRGRRPLSHRRAAGHPPDR